MKNCAKVVEGNCADRLVVFESVNQTAAESVLSNKLICCYILFFYSLVKGLIRYHKITKNIIKYGLLLDNAR